MLEAKSQLGINSREDKKRKEKVRTARRGNLFAAICRKGEQRNGVVTREELGVVKVRHLFCCFVLF